MWSAHLIHTWLEFSDDHDDFKSAKIINWTDAFKIFYLSNFKLTAANTFD